MCPNSSQENYISMPTPSLSMLHYTTLTFLISTWRLSLQRHQLPPNSPLCLNNICWTTQIYTSCVHLKTLYSLFNLPKCMFFVTSFDFVAVIITKWSIWDFYRSIFNLISIVEISHSLPGSRSFNLCMIFQVSFTKLFLDQCCILL